MKHDGISNVIENLKPAIEAITDNNIKSIIDALLVIISEQQKIIETQRKEIAELKEKLNTNSGNSSKPPSTNHDGVYNLLNTYRWTQYPLVRLI